MTFSDRSWQLSFWSEGIVRRIFETLFRNWRTDYHFPLQIAFFAFYKSAKTEKTFHFSLIFKHGIPDFKIKRLMWQLWLLRPLYNFGSASISLSFSSVFIKVYLKRSTLILFTVMAKFLCHHLSDSQLIYDMTENFFIFFK